MTWKRTPERETWTGMMSRCFNRKQPSFARNYGVDQRGISRIQTGKRWQSEGEHIAQL